MPQPQLPTELLRAIIAELGSDKRRPSLAACCLVSKAMLPLVQEELYHSVHVLIENQGQDQGRVRSEQLSATVRSHPRIAALVKTLVICPMSNATGQQVRLTAEALVGACERLRQFKVYAGAGHNEEGPEWLEQLLEKRGKTLHSLDVEGHYRWSAVAFVDMLNHLPRLQHLALREAPIVDDDPNHLPRPSFHLQTLNLSDPAPPALLDLLLSASHDSLRQLRFVGVSAQGPSTTHDFYDFSSCHSLRSVSVSCYLPSMASTNSVHLFQTIGSIRSLRTLNIDAFGYEPDAPGDVFEAVDFLRLLPPSLLHLHAGQSSRFPLHTSSPFWATAIASLRWDPSILEAPAVVTAGRRRGLPRRVWPSREPRGGHGWT